ncbi:hypothetical protein L1887_53663 [Cichorium endivia]|nr:hypothetical protein L1887_53663 [Cichorium endivia]
MPSRLPSPDGMWPSSITTCFTRRTLISTQLRSPARVPTRVATTRHRRLVTISRRVGYPTTATTFLAQALMFASLNQTFLAIVLQCALWRDDEGENDIRLDALGLGSCAECFDLSLKLLVGLVAVSQKFTMASSTHSTPALHFEG